MTESSSEPVPTGALLADFVEALVASGEVQVSVGAALPDDAEVLPILGSLDAQVREELAFSAPPLDPLAGAWAVRQLYHACRFLVCRDIPAAEVTRQLGLKCARPRGPSTDYSVDLLFHFLPQILEVSERHASDDALTVALRVWAREWPLSSVGARVAGPFAIDSFATSAALLQLYVDRITRAVAAERLDDSRVATLLRSNLGAYPNLAPALASALNRVPATSLT